MKTFVYPLVVMLLWGISGCKDLGEGDATRYGIDARLLGNWYRFDTLSLTSPGPRLVLDAMQIRSDMTIAPLGIEFSTGNVALVERGELKQMLAASGGLLVVTHVAHPDIVTDSLMYAFTGNALVLTDRFATRRFVYHRTVLGSRLTDPVQVTVRVDLDGAPVQSPQVATIVPAYVGKAASRLQFSSTFPAGWVTITIDDFAGTGTYTIGPSKAALKLFAGDVVITLPNDTSFPGTITIDTFDEVTNRCAGRFEFTAQLRLLPGDPPFVRHLRNGVFSVPLYR